LMDSARPKLAAELERVKIAAPSAPVISNVTARPHETLESIRALLVDQVTAPVRWEESMRYLLAQGFTRFIEWGPGTALSGFMKRIDKVAQVANVSDAASLANTIEMLKKS